MKSIKTAAKKILGTLLGQDLLGRIGSRYFDLENLLTYNTSPLGRKSKERLGTFRDKHKNERCFIIGNGPSLNRMDLSPLKDEVTFGLNRIYLLFDRLGFCTSYYIAVNPNVVEQSAAEIEALECPKFISWGARNFLSFSPDTAFIRSRSGPRFCNDVSAQGVWEGATVTYAAMQIAYYMGFSEAILIGVDHNFKTRGDPHKLVVSQGEDPNHFDPNYFGKGVKWQLPDLKTSEQAYALAKEAYENSGRRILDATVDGKLTIFPKVSYENVVGINQ
jgi:hypothetical protein